VKTSQQVVISPQTLYQNMPKTPNSPNLGQTQFGQNSDLLGFSR
jgi:hypothetical protein